MHWAAMTTPLIQRNNIISRPKTANITPRFKYLKLLSSHTPHRVSLRARESPLMNGAQGVKEMRLPLEIFVHCKNLIMHNEMTGAIREILYVNRFQI